MQDGLVEFRDVGGIVEIVDGGIQADLYVLCPIVCYGGIYMLIIGGLLFEKDMMILSHDEMYDVRGE